MKIYGGERRRYRGAGRNSLIKGTFVMPYKLHKFNDEFWAQHLDDGKHFKESWILIST